MNFLFSVSVCFLLAFDIDNVFYFIITFLLFFICLLGFGWKFSKNCSCSYHIISFDGEFIVPYLKRVKEERREIDNISLNRILTTERHIDWMVHSIPFTSTFSFSHIIFITRSNNVTDRINLSYERGQSWVVILAWFFNIRNNILLLLLYRYSQSVNCFLRSNKTLKYKKKLSNTLSIFHQLINVNIICVFYFSWDLESTRPFYASSGKRPRKV